MYIFDKIISTFMSCLFQVLRKRVSIGIHNMSRKLRERKVALSVLLTICKYMAYTQLMLCKIVYQLFRMEFTINTFPKKNVLRN